MSGKSSIIATGFAHFYKAIGSDGSVRYFPESGATSREDAFKYHAKDEPPDVLGGYAAYDMVVSSDYAVALYSTKEEAAAHGGTEPPSEGDSAAFVPDTADSPSINTAKAAPRRAFGNKRRGK